jgi:LPXTG-motif cell wall-anchored protein
MLPATGSSSVPYLVALAALLTLSGGALITIRRR